MLTAIEHCERCGSEITEPVCPRCYEAIKPKGITFGKLDIESTAPIDTIRQKLARRHGVPVDQVRFEGARNEGRAIFGDFVVSQSINQHTAGNPCPACGGDLVPSARLPALLHCASCQESFCITIDAGPCQVTP